jgi:hypothetical protein
MAQLFPSIEAIARQYPNPDNARKAELKLLKFLANTLADDWEVYFQPFLNGDLPDIVLLREKHGVLIIEVKNWTLSKYAIDKKKWVLRHDRHQLIKSPIDQVNQYKNNFYDLHIPNLLQTMIKESKYYGIIQTQVYFNNETQESVNSWFKDRSITPKWCDLIGNDSLDVSSYTNILNKQRLNLPKSYFDKKLYLEFKRFLQPPLTVLEKNSNNLKLNGKQEKLAISEANKQQKVKGVAGSGKTFVLAQRAVNSHLRHKNRVLILTYNITLRNYIHDHISRVREGLNWKNFYILHYHGFFKTEANNYSQEIKLDSFDEVDFFENIKDQIVKFHSIFIDEIQDYKSEWIQIIKKYFLADDGEFVVFGDEKQNIYHRELLEDTTPNTTIPGKWSSLTDSYRFSNKIVPLLTKFQQVFFSDTYSLDKIVSLRQQELFVEESIKYIPINSNFTLISLVDKIEAIMKENNTHENDACVLGSRIAVLRGIDLEFRKRKLNTMVTFEDQETYDFVMGPEYRGRSPDADIKEIRQSKKFNFWMNNGTIKLSTIHSFKGWEISSLFLVINPKEDNDELIYTAITRCRHNLFIINIENEHYGDFFSLNIEPQENIVLTETSKQVHQIQIPQNIYDKTKFLKNVTDEKELAFNAIVEGMKVLGWLDNPKIKKKSRKNEAFGAVIEGMKTLGWDADIQQAAIENSTKTIDEIESLDLKTTNENLKRNLKGLLEILRGNHNKFKILIYGQIECEKKEIEADLNRYFHDLNLSQNEWEVDFCIKARDMKKLHMGQLKKGQSSYSLIATANIPQHKTKGNSKGSITSTLRLPGYIPFIMTCNPKKKPSSSKIINKLENFFIEKIDEITKPKNPLDFYNN